MTRQQFNAARRLLRTFASLVREAIAAQDAGDCTKVWHAYRWMRAEFEPNEPDIDAVRHTLRPGEALTTQVGMIRALPEQRADRIFHVRMQRYYRAPCRLPA